MFKCITYNVKFSFAFWEESFYRTKLSLWILYRILCRWMTKKWKLVQSETLGHVLIKFIQTLCQKVLKVFFLYLYPQTLTDRTTIFYICVDAICEMYINKILNKDKYIQPNFILKKENETRNI